MYLSQCHRCVTAAVCAVCRAELFTGDFPELGPPLVHSQSVGQRFKMALEAARTMLAGESPMTNWPCAWRRPALGSCWRVSHA